MGGMLRSALFAVAFVSSGCHALQPPPPLPPQEVVVRVSTGDGEPLHGVAVRTSTGPQGQTDDRGVAVLKIDGEEGAKVNLSIVCPTGFAAAASTHITLRRADRPPVFDIPCRPYEHAVVIAFKTTGAPNLPISYLGAELTRTDEAGYALVELEPKVGESLKFTFDTSDPKLKHLRPQNPEVTIRVPDGDETFTIEQRFIEDRPKVIKIVKPIPKPVEIVAPKR
jgi:hypothetical protein